MAPAARRRFKGRLEAPREETRRSDSPKDGASGTLTSLSGWVGVSLSGRCQVHTLVQTLALWAQALPHVGILWCHTFAFYFYF